MSDEAYDAVERLKAELQAMYDSLEAGKVYDFELGKYNTRWRTQTYRVLAKEKHHEWSYSVLCKSVESGGVIYHWMLPSGVNVERIIGFKEVK